MSKKKLTIIDTTLRDGEQSAGVAFSYKEKISIAKHLDVLGVDVIEAGIPMMSQHERKTIQSILELGLDASILTWNRMNIKDIKASMETGATNNHISVPDSDLHIYKKLRLTRDQLETEYLKVLEFCQRHDLNVSIGGEDASRADEAFLAHIFSLGINHGVKRIRYADTVSVLSPFTSFEKIERLIWQLSIRQELKKEELLKLIDLDFHGHNDFGLGTANAIGAFRAGANAISCSINGLGERAGNTPLEEIVLALEIIENIPNSIQTKEIMRVSKLVEEYSGRKLQSSKPIVGDMVFSHESGIHVDGLLKDKKTYSYLDPKILGRHHSYIRGKHSGKSIKLIPRA